MFKKLRNRFLFINMIAIVLVLLVAFIAIFTITLSNVQDDIRMQLERTAFQNISIPNKPNNIEIISNNPDNFSSPSITFWIALDNEKNILEVFNPNYSGLTEDAANEMAELVLEKTNSSGYFKMNGSYWAYQLSETFIGYKLTFLDVTNSFNILSNLLYSFLLVSAVTILVIFLFSKYFADKAIQPIQETFDKQKQFVSNASHELKTPLTVINTNIDLVLTNPDSTIQSQEKWLQYIKEESNRMSKLTNDLLYLARMDYTEQNKVLLSIDFSSLVEKSILPMEAIAYEKEITLTYQIAPNIQILGDPDQLQQVIIIILDNAIKYCNPNGTVSIDLINNTTTATLKITNTGSGIDSEHLTHIFDRFYRVDSSRNRTTGGYGLGLSIAKSIVDAHKGKIEIQSSSDTNTTVKITLPTKK